MKSKVKWLITLAMLPSFASAITLDECQRLARENYPLIKQYEAINEISAADADVASKNYLPQFNVYGQASWQNAVTSFPESVRQMFANNTGTSIAGLSKDQYSIGAELTQMIWDGGKTKAERQKTQADTEASMSQTDVELYKIVDAVNDLYFNVLLYENQLALNDELQRVLDSNLAVVEASRANGTAMESDVAAIRAKLCETRQSRITIEYTLAANKRMLGLYVGRDIANETFERPVVGGLFSTDASHRPEIAVYEARRKQLQVQRQSVSASIMPQIGLFANGYYGNPGFDMFDAMFYDDWSFNFIVGVKVQWNIGELYRRSSRLKHIEASSRYIDNEQEAFEFNISLLTEQQQAMIDMKRKEIEADGEIMDLRKLVRKASEAKLRDGIITVNDLLRDIVDENNAHIAKNIHEIELLHSVYKLKYIVNQ